MKLGLVFGRNISREVREAKQSVVFYCFFFFV